MKKLFIIPLFLIVTASVLKAQSYDLKYNFQKGHTYLYQDSLVNDITQSMMGQEMKVNSSAYNIIRVVTDDNSKDGITLIISFDSVIAKTKAPMMDTTISMDQLLGKRFKMVISPKGQVITKEMIDSVDIEGEMMQMGQREAMQFGKLPEKSVKIGEKWTITQVDTLDMMGGKTVMTSENEFTLSGKDEKLGISVLKIPYTSKVKMEGKGNMMGFEFFMEGTGTAEGNYYFSYEQGIPVFSEANQTFDVTMAATGDQNMIIPISQTMKTTRMLVK